MIWDVHPGYQILIFFPSSRTPDTRAKIRIRNTGGKNLPEGCAPDALGPDGLVEAGVNPHISCSHLLLSKLLDLLRHRVKKTGFVNQVERLQRRLVM
jgi:hypothetical protein